MKKILLLIIIVTFISCETKTVEIEKTAGEWLMDGNWNGKNICWVMTSMRILH